MSTKSRAWYGFDLDKTLAEYPSKDGAEIGAPIFNIVRVAKKYLLEGKDVRIFTARVSVIPGEEHDPEVGNARKIANIRSIKAWCTKVFGRELPITCSKDRLCIELWDDRAVQVVPNTGEILQDTVEMMTRYQRALKGTK
jgi:hypothetical protein